MLASFSTRTLLTFLLPVIPVDKEILPLPNNCILPLVDYHYLFTTQITMTEETSTRYLLS